MANFTELLNSLSSEQVESWWDNYAPDKASDKEESDNWKYWIVKSGKKLPFKYVIKSLAKHYKVALESFGSSLENRNKFCKKFGFELDERLVYDSTERNTFINYIKTKIENHDAFQDFINYAHNVIDKSDIVPAKIRMAINAKGEILIVIAMRIVLSYKENQGVSTVRFVIDEKDYINLREKINFQDMSPFKGSDRKVLVRVDISNWKELPQELLKANGDEINSFYNQYKNSSIIKWNEDAKTSNSAIKSVIFENENVENWISNSFSSEGKSINEKKMEHIKNSNEIGLNQILYGPPGTGKTYSTIEKAIKIANPDYSSLYSRNEVKLEFDRLQKRSRVFFTTFHQSLSYEDFIEGIKPMKPDESGQITYDIVPGIFKQACAMAGYYCYTEYLNSEKNSSNYSFDDLYDAFILNIKALFEKNTPPVYKTLRGRDVEVKEINRNNSVIARAKDSIAESSAPLRKENLQKLYDKFTSIDEIIDLNMIKETVQVSPRLTEFYAVFRGLKDFEKSFTPNADYIKENREAENIDIKEIQIKFDTGVYHDAILKHGAKCPAVVFIIDEINRGNVSQIFGELITLLEEDKRIGKAEALEAMLPYSKEYFAVPPNLHVLGTMNTADRSVEALDTALRRRFSFEEIMPQPDLVKQTVQGIILKDILVLINERIEALLDRDHLIGHSYFMNVKDSVELRTVFKNKIIPLLQEYFYGDYGKIGLVLGEGFVTKNNPKKATFANFPYPGKEEFIVEKFSLIPISDDFDIVSAINKMIE